eukprot:Rmarinus@m.16561
MMYSVRFPSLRRLIPNCCMLQLMMMFAIAWPATLRPMLRTQVTRGGSAGATHLFLCFVHLLWAWPLPPFSTFAAANAPTLNTSSATRALQCLRDIVIQYLVVCVDFSSRQELLNIRIVFGFSFL